MSNNKAFAGYVVFLVSGASLLIGSLILAGIASVPPLTTFLTDVTMGLCIRAAYKQIGGWDWAEWSWSFAGDPPEVIAAMPEVLAGSSDLAQAA